MASALAARRQPCASRRVSSRNIKVIHAHMHAEQRWNDLGIGPLLSLPTLAKLGTTGEVPQTLAHACVELSRMHTCECRANSQHRHASDDIGLHGAHGRVRLAETGVGTRGTNPHPKHALERRQYPLCGREILSLYPPTDYTRQQRSAYGRTHADRPSASKMPTSARQA